MTNTKAALGTTPPQTAMVIYKRGLKGDYHNGLGNSQKGEVQWLEDHDVQFEKCDINDFPNLASLAHQELDVTKRGSLDNEGNK